MIAGPNGAGKTTLTLELMKSTTTLYEFLNADEIARGLAPKHPESVALTASKLMINRLKALLQDEKNFTFETTAAGTNYVKYLKEAKAKGYTISLMYLWLSSPDQAIKRVAQRVQHGGHHIPADVIRRRYFTGLRNLLEVYLPLADSANVLNNSVDNPEEKHIARKSHTGNLDIIDSTIWDLINREAYG